MSSEAVCKVNYWTDNWIFSIFFLCSRETFHTDTATWRDDSETLSRKIYAKVIDNGDSRAKGKEKEFSSTSKTNFNFLEFYQIQLIYSHSILLDRRKISSCERNFPKVLKNNFPDLFARCTTRILLEMFNLINFNDSKVISSRESEFSSKLMSFLCN